MVTTAAAVVLVVVVGGAAVAVGGVVVALAMSFPARMRGLSTAISLRGWNHSSYKGGEGKRGTCSAI